MRVYQLTNSVCLACSDPRQMFYNIEMAPNPDKKNESHLSIKEISLGGHNYHTNQYVQ